MGESDNLADAGTETVETSATDTPETWDYYDPDEDTVETPEEPSTENEGEEAPVEADAEATEDEATEAPADRYVLSDGTEVSLDELKSGHLRQADYSRKTLEVAETRKAVVAESNRIANITKAFIEHMGTLMPAEPPMSLAFSNPGLYTAQKAQFDAAEAQMQKLVDIGTQAKGTTDNLTNAERHELLKAEDAKLQAALPQTRTQEGRQKFFSEALSTARALGYADHELSQISDHRLYLVLNMAARGLAADKAVQAAKTKVLNVPPVAPKAKPGQSPGQTAQQMTAIRKFARSGSLRDAAKLDWD